MRLYYHMAILTGMVYSACPASAQDKDTLPMVHDPVMVQAGNKYYVFGTGWGIDMMSSTDRRHWRREPPVFDRPPEWAVSLIKGFKGHIWAPDIHFHNGKYYLYYSVSLFGKNTSAIGVATNVTLDPADKNYKWTDHGKVVQSIPGRDDWNAIDPNLSFDENNVPWLAFGSFWNGIKLVRLGSSLLNVANPEQWRTIAVRKRSEGLSDTLPGDGAIEAPFLYRNKGFYYLFVSFEYCCSGAKSTYEVRIGRSRAITGPYLDKDGRRMENGGGSFLIGGDDRYFAVGHNAVAALKEGDYFVSHGYDRLDDGKPKLIIRKINWKDGWPFLEN